MQFKKTFVLCLSLLVLAGCVISGTLAFSIPDVFSASNNQDDVLPHIDITLNIAEDKKAFLIPEQDFKKEVTVSNSAQSSEPVYVWYTYALPEILLNFDDPGNSPLTVRFSEGSDWKNNVSVYPNENYQSISYGDMDYVQFTCLHVNPLAPGETSETGMKCLRLDRHIDRIDGEFHWVEGDTSIPLGYTSPTVEIPFHAVAVSAVGFASVQEAYAAYYGSDASQLLTSESSNF